MPQAATESTKPTEMIWCMLRSELASFVATQKVRMRRLSKAGFTSDEYAAIDDLKMKDGFITEIEEMIETKYLRFCDPPQPLQLMTLLGARVSMNLIRFLAHHPRRWVKLDHVPTSERQLVWNIVIQLLEQYKMMQSNPQLRHFAWNVPYFIQWHAVIHILDTLRADPLHPDALKAWQLIDALYENNSDMLLSIKRPIFIAVGNLCLRAFSSRTAALTKERSLSDPPEYIAKLRELRETAKTRGEETIAGSKIHCGKERLATTGVDALWSDIGPMSAEALVEAQLQQYPIAKQPVNPVPRTEDDSF